MPADFFPPYVLRWESRLLIMFNPSEQRKHVRYQMSVTPFIFLTALAFLVDGPIFAGMGAFHLRPGMQQFRVFF